MSGDDKLLMPYLQQLSDQHGKKITEQIVVPGPAATKINEDFMEEFEKVREHAGESHKKGYNTPAASYDSGYRDGMEKACRIFNGTDSE